MNKATRFSTRTMRRRGHRDGEAIGQAIIERFAPRFTEAGVYAGLEQEMENFGLNKLARAVQDMRDEGAPHPAAMQYHAALAAGMADKLHGFRATLAAPEQVH